jgi:hypothetical protein
MVASDYGRSVFINCPFDKGYSGLFEAIVFAVFDCGFRARCALEIDDGSQVRIEKIFSIILDCQFGVHDISRTDLDPASGLPRFNMPLELGFFLGAKRYGRGQQREKTCLILDREKYRYQTFISDLAGQDIREHQNDEKQAITVVRNWLRSASRTGGIPGGKAIADRYQRFRSELPALCDLLRLSTDELTFNDFTLLVSEWLKAHI